MDPQNDRQMEMERKKKTMEYLKKSRKFSRPRNIDLGRQSQTLEEIHHILADCGIPMSPSISKPTAVNPPAENGVNGTNGVLSDGYHHPPPRPSALKSSFEMIDTQQVVVPPKNDPTKSNMAYSKTTQTEDERISVGEFSMGSQEFDYDEFSDTGGKVDMNFDDSPGHELVKLLPSLGIGSRILQDENVDPQEERVPDLSEDEKRQILQSDEFLAFFVKAGKVMVRELAEINDTTSDYAYDFSLDEAQTTGELITLNREFVDPNVVGRSVGALDYSTFHPELLAAAYNYGIDSTTIHPGIVHVWNSKFKANFPEYTFTAPSPITAFQFARYHSNIMIGGLFTGQVCVWDNRVNKKTPVQRSPLIVTAHTQPIYCLNIVGSKNAHDLVTISTDGRMCSWALDNLTSPIETVTLAYKQKRALPVYSMGFWNTGAASFAAGTYEGALYIGDRHGKGDMAKSLEIHKSMITALDLHKAPGASNDFSNLCLTSSWDWSIKLTELSFQDSSLGSAQNSSILSFNQHKDLVQDVKWSPVHPAVFASVDSAGQLMIWNLNLDTESPITCINIGAPGQKLLWNANGSQLVVGDKQGRVLLYDVHENISNPKSDEWERLRGILHEVQTSSNEIVSTEIISDYSTA